MDPDNDFAYTDEEGAYLVRLARRSLTEYLKTGKMIDVPKDAPPKPYRKSGVFVTLERHGVPHEMALRGCIGRPYPNQSLLAGVIVSAIDAGVNDWRFSPVRPEELNTLIFEVTALTPPEKIEASFPEDILRQIEIGRDGLIIETKNRTHAGLFLPQVPVEWHWNKKEYLDHLCNKAGLPAGTWKKIDKINIYKFRGEIFTEVEPNGDIIRKILKKE